MSLDVAVVIPTRNRGRLVGEAVASVLGQSRPAREVIVVDDASEGAEASTVASLAEGHREVRVLRLPERRGGAVARNVGWGATTCELVAFLDDDDLWHREKLERQVALLAAERADFSWTGIESVSRVDGRLVGRHEAMDAGYPELLVLSPLWCSTLLVRRDALERVGGFDEALPRNQDWDLFLRLFSACSGVPLAGAWTTVRAGRPDARACLEGRALFFEKWRGEIERLPDEVRRRAHFAHHWLRWGNLAQLGDVRGEWGALCRMAPLGWTDARLWRSLALTLLHSVGWSGRHAGREAA